MNYAFPMNGYGADSEFDAICYGQHHPSTINFLRDQFNTVRSTLTEPARLFMEKGREMFEHFNGTEAMRFARDVVNRVKGVTSINIDNVKPLITLAELQSAGLVMQRWVMANPNVRERYHNQQLDGYFGSYIDMSPQDIGVDHYDYRRVMDGVVQITDNAWKIVQYHDQLVEGDRDLMIEEKSDIIHTWSALDYLLALNEDPTNPNG